MHCRACDKLLTDYEATRKNANTFEFIDLCKVCFEDVKAIVPTIDRKDLLTESDLDEDFDDPSSEDYDDYINYIVSRENYDIS